VAKMEERRKQREDLLSLLVVDIDTGARHQGVWAIRTKKAATSSASPMSLIDSGTFTSTSRVTRTTQLQSGAYVLSLASTSSHYAAASSAPTNAIHLYDKTDLRATQTLPGHDGAITCLRAVAGSDGALVSSGKDGLVNIWDTRIGSVALRSESLHRP
jgi:WD repeat-containing protein 89